MAALQEAREQSPRGCLSEVMWWCERLHSLQKAPLLPRPNPKPMAVVAEGARGDDGRTMRTRSSTRAVEQPASASATASTEAIDLDSDEEEAEVVEVEEGGDDDEEGEEAEAQCEDVMPTMTRLERSVRAALERLIQRVQKRAERNERKRAREEQKQAERNERKRARDEERAEKQAMRAARRAAEADRAEVRSALDELITRVEIDNPPLQAMVLSYIPGELWGGPPPVLALLAAVADEMKCTTVEPGVSPLGKPGRRAGSTMTRWTEMEDNHLLFLVSTGECGAGRNGGIADWETAATYLGTGRSAHAVEQRYMKCLQFQ